MRRALLGVVLLVGACRDRSDDCTRAVGHFLGLGSAADPRMSREEREATSTVIATVTSACRKEGLAHEVAACILATHWPDPDDQLRACPAFAANPPSWLHLRPARDGRAAMLADRQDTAVPANGPYEGPVHYMQIVGTADTTCGLTAAGAVQCWGAPLPAGVPSGTFTQLAISEQRTCGLDSRGYAHCTAGKDAIMSVAPRIPDEAFSAIAIGDADGCGIGKRDGYLMCWSDTDAPAHVVPAGTFTQLAMTDYDVCALRADHHVVCSGGEAPAAPTKTLALLGTGWPYSRRPDMPQARFS